MTIFIVVRREMFGAQNTSNCLSLVIIFATVSRFTQLSCHNRSEFIFSMLNAVIRSLYSSKSFIGSAIMLIARYKIINDSEQSLSLRTKQRIDYFSVLYSRITVLESPTTANDAQKRINNKRKNKIFEWMRFCVDQRDHCTLLFRTENRLYLSSIYGIN